MRLTLQSSGLAYGQPLTLAVRPRSPHGAWRSDLPVLEATPRRDLGRLVEIEVSAEVSRDWGQSRMKPQIRRHMGLQKT